MALLRSASLSDLGPVIRADRVILRTPQMADYPSWAEIRAASRDFLTPWEPLWASDELSRASFRRRVLHYQRDLRGCRLCPVHLCLEFWGPGRGADSL